MRTHPLLDQLAAQGIRLGLDRIRQFLQAMGEPQNAYPAVHVAGTNGKGSVCSMVTAVLVEAGYSVGTTYSPHLESLNERVQIDGVPVDDGVLTEAIEAVDRVRWDWARLAGIEGAPLTYYEFMISAALHVFAKRNVDIAVVEVGLGGRLDASNVVQPVVSAVTSIGLDHQALLGDTVAEIAGEKAGIFKRGVPVVTGPMAAEARQAIEVRAKALGCPLWSPPALRREHRRGRWSFAGPGGSISDVTLGSAGAHQGVNAMVATGIVHRLSELGFVIDDAHIRAGLARPGLPGRLERLRPDLVIDGAHNAAGAQALALWLAEQPRPANRILLLGMGVDRNPVDIVKPLLPFVDEVVTTRCAHPKARDPLELAHAVQDELELDLSAGEEIETTLPEVLADADEVIVAGSLFVAGAARSLFREGALDQEA